MRYAHFAGSLVVLCACFSLGGQAYGATFGNSSGTLTATYDIEGIICANTFTLSEDGMATSMTAYIRVTGSAKNMRLGIWRDSDSALVGYTEQRSITAAAAEQTFNFYPPIPLYAGNYRLGAWSAAALGFGQLGDDGSSASVSYEQAVTYSGATISPMVFGTYSTGQPLAHIFCTYTPTTIKVFGDTVVGPTVIAIEDAIHAGLYTSPATSVRVDSLVGWVDFSVHTTTSSTRGSRMALYNVDSTLIAQTNTVNIETANDKDGRIVYSFASPPTLTASTPVRIALWSDTSYGSIQCAVTDVRGKSVRIYNASGWAALSGSYPNPLNSTLLDADYKLSVWAYYTDVSAGGGFNPRELILKKKNSFGIVGEAVRTFAGNRYDIPY